MKLHTVSLDITTACDQACPDCCCGIHMHRPAVHHDWPYFERAAEVLRGVDRVIVTGGEPTLHPNFPTLSSRFRELFGCRVLTLNSNGWGFDKWARIIAKTYDWVDFSDYGLGRDDAANEVRRYRGDRGFVRRINMTKPDDFVSRIRRGNGKPCSRACWRSGGFAYADGKLWGCCVAPGIEGAQGIEPGPMMYREEQLLAAPLPCENCFFAE